MSLDIHKETEEKMSKTLESCGIELSGVRAGRANPSILDRITVEYYGTMTPLNQVANISAPEPRMIVIQPFDASLIEHIEKVISTSDLGINPSNDGKIIRLSVPQLTEERRIELTKVVKKIGESSKVAIRNQRREANDAVKKMAKANEITEDEEKQAEDKIQKITDKFVGEIEKLVESKEKEVMEV